MVKIIGKIDIGAIDRASEDKFGDSWDNAENEQYYRKLAEEELYKLSNLSIDEIAKLSDEELKAKIDYYINLEREKEKKESEEERRRHRERVRSTMLYDFSGDDSSLDSRFL